MIKKIPLLLAATGLVLSAGVSAQSVSIPNLKSGFEFNIEGWFLRPSNSDLDYELTQPSFSGISRIAKFVGSSAGPFATFKPHTGFALGLGMRYVFPDSASDAQLQWTRFDHTATSTTLLSVLPSLPTGFSSAEANVDGISNKEIASVRNRLSDINLNAGQYIAASNQLQLHPAAGLRFARVESRLRDQSITLPVLGLASMLVQQGNNTDQFTSRFSGIGPSLGLDARYSLGGGVAAVAHAATSLLLGKAHSNSNLESSDGNALIKSETVTRVVPALDAGLGLDYKYSFSDGSILTFEGGYKAAQFIDAIDRLTGQFDSPDEQIIVQAPLPPSSNLTSVKRTSSSLGFSGPYVKLSLKI